MKVTVNAHELRTTVNWAAAFANANAMLPVCSAAVLRAQDGRLLVQSTDLASVATGFVRAEVASEEGCLIIEARALKKYLSKVGRKKGTTLSIDGNVFSAGGVEVSLDAMEDPDELPTTFFGWRDKGECTSCAVDLARLRLGKVARFMQGPDSGRLVLESVLAEILKDGRLRIAAADGFKLVRMGPEGEVAASGLIPSKAITMMSKMKGNATLTLGDNYAGMSIKGGRVDTSLTDGTFPDYEQIIPKAEPMVATLNTAQFRETLETLSAVAEDRFLKMALEDGKATLSQERDTPCTASIPAVWDDDKFDIGFDPRLVLDVLALCGERLELKLYGPNRPMRIDDGEATMVVMPRHIEE